MRLFRNIREDIRTVFAGDPAARTVWEVIFCYPGLHAIWLHRIAHRLWRWRLFFLGRLVSHISRMLTGVSIPCFLIAARRLVKSANVVLVEGERYSCEVINHDLTIDSSVGLST